jgi:hypothetical protein
MRGLKYSIEYFSKELEHLIQERNYNFHDMDVIQLSQILDEFICIFYSYQEFRS